MKKPKGFLTILFVLPLLMSNSPAPNPFPTNYNDYNVENIILSSELIETSNDQYTYKVKGKISNTGNRCIDLSSSYIKIYLNDKLSSCLEFNLFDNFDMNTFLVKSNETAYFNSLCNNYSTAFAPTSGSENITFNRYELQVLAFNETDVLSNVSYEQGLISIDNEYKSQSQTTAIKIQINEIFNHSGHTISAIVIRYNIDGQDYYLFHNINISNESKINISLDSSIKKDVSNKTGTVTDVTFLKINSYYENYYNNLKIIEYTLIAVGAILLIAVIAIPIVIVIVHKKRHS